jgi:dihydroorotate dehydrogenase
MGRRSGAKGVGLSGTSIGDWLYKIPRAILFSLPPETAHHWVSAVLRLKLATGPMRSFAHSFYDVNDPALEIERFGIRFPNPIGLAAGFDKSGSMFNELGALGFGFIEIGTITAHPQPGNPQPRLFRLPEDEALLNRMGFNNPGAAAVAARLANSRIEPILGINIGKSKITPLEEAESDYLKSLELLEPFAKYVVVNVSSPNTPGLRSLQNAEALEKLLTAISDRKKGGQVPFQKDVELREPDSLIPIQAAKPILLKIAPDLNDEQLQEIIAVAQRTGISGIIATNTTISREGLQTPAENVAALGDGGISGKPLRLRSRQMVHRIYELTAGTMPIIGVGGVFDADDAWQLITAGASLVQVYTGFIYGGPGIAKRINSGLLALLHRHGLHRLEDAVGLSHRQTGSDSP